MKTTCLLLIAITFSFFLHAQNSRTRFSIGPEFSIPTYHEFPSNGIGASAGVEFKSKRRTSATIDIGYNYFKGTVINYWFPDTIRGFSFVPVLGGVKFSLKNKFYVAARGGITFGYSGLTAFTFSPAAGIMLPNKEHPRFDIGARWLGIIGMPTYPEKTFIEKGNYSYLNFRAAIVF